MPDLEQKEYGPEKGKVVFSSSDQRKGGGVNFAVALVEVGKAI